MDCECFHEIAADRAKDKDAIRRNRLNRHCKGETMNVAISTQSCAKNLVLKALIAMIAVGSAASFGDTPSPTAGDTTSPTTSAELQEVTVTASKREETASRV